MFRRFFRRLFRKEKPRVYLGTIAVVPRADFKRYFENWDLLDIVDQDRELKKRLIQIFALHPASDVQDPTAADLGLDVLIPYYQNGQLIFEDFGKFPVLFFWRPRIEVRSRLYRLKTQKTIATFAVKEKLPWKEFAKRSAVGIPFALFGLFDLSSDISQQDLDYLLDRACQKLLIKMIAKI